MKKILIIIIVFSALAIYSYAQEEVKGLKQIFDITMDDVGNAKIEVSMKLTASQWDVFKKNMGNNTSIMKREMEKAMPKYYLSDFNYSEDQMERIMKIKFNALGLTKINEQGIWEAKLDTKDPDFTKLSDREFVINSTMINNGMLMQATQKIHLPSGASDARIDKDSFGKAVLTYKTGSSGGGKMLTYGGIALILGAGFLFYRNSKGPKNNLHVAKAA